MQPKIDPRMSPAARKGAEQIVAADEIVGALELWSASLSDDGRGCLTYGDEASVWKLYSDGAIDKRSFI